MDFFDKEDPELFLHEDRTGSTSWRDKDISHVASFPEVFNVKSPICRWKVFKGNVNSAGFVRQAINWLDDQC